MVGVFDRSQYEDVLIHRVHGWADAGELERRYAAINDFESRLHEQGTTIVKVMLNISKDEQKKRLIARLDDPSKHWKYSRGDLAERAYWDEYMDAYSTAFEKTSTDIAPCTWCPPTRSGTPASLSSNCCWMPWVVCNWIGPRLTLMSPQSVPSWWSPRP